MSAALRRFAVLLLLLAGVAALCAWYAIRSVDEPLALAATLRYKVAPGASFARVAGDLGTQGVVAHPKVWVLFARWQGLAGAIKAGEYDIEPGMTPRDLLAKMVGGQVVMHSFTIIDGWRVQDLLAALRRNPDVLSTLPANPPDLMEKIGSPGVDPEGRFLPETYRFPGGTSDVEILKLAHAALDHVLEAAWTERDPALPLALPAPEPETREGFNLDRAPAGGFLPIVHPSGPEAEYGRDGRSVLQSESSMASSRNRGGDSSGLARYGRVAALAAAVVPAIVHHMVHHM